MLENACESIQTPEFSLALSRPWTPTYMLTSLTYHHYAMKNVLEHLFSRAGSTTALSVICICIQIKALEQLTAERKTKLQIFIIAFQKILYIISIKNLTQGLSE